MVIYGTPAEENLAGKITMLEEGCFRDIDVALMMHGSPTTTCDIKSMANYHIDVVFEGKSSHAAINPDKGRSALDALLLTFQGIEFLRNMFQKIPACIILWQIHITFLPMLFQTRPKAASYSGLSICTRWKTYSPDLSA